MHANAYFVCMYVYLDVLFIERAQEITEMGAWLPAIRSCVVLLYIRRRRIERKENACERGGLIIVNILLERIWLLF